MQQVERVLPTQPPTQSTGATHLAWRTARRQLAATPPLIGRTISGLGLRKQMLSSEQQTDVSSRLLSPRSQVPEQSLTALESERHSAFAATHFRTHVEESIPNAIRQSKHECQCRVRCGFRCGRYLHCSGWTCYCCTDRFGSRGARSDSSAFAVQNAIARRSGLVKRPQELSEPNTEGGDTCAYHGTRAGILPGRRVGG